ncbi:flagellar hook-length control protein [Parvibaculum lavamentivorans DS-1]|uniref:Flagellar hook-length control protein n=2 Tax=Parvibaculum lavamentivorans TaxID=256618 RepID=A7HV68_PARL1|nr:flagellar hook-length control protein [Parvibaculum lavamentivorans DS-1]
MDMSSSATQRSNTSSDTLVVQPTTVRAAVASAANEFARHLADSTADTARRRDDRPAERRERNETRGPAHREQTESHSARREQTPSETDDVQEPAIAVQVDTATGDIPLEETPTEETVATIEDAPEEADIPPAVHGESEQQTNDGTLATAAPQINTPAKAEPEATTALPVATTGEKPAAAANPDNAGEALPAGLLKADRSMQATAEPSQNTPSVEEGAVPNATLPTAKNTTPPAGQQIRPEATADIDPVTVTAELESAVVAKPSKGLGHNAADQLADKKAEAKQASAQAAVAPQAVTPSQAQGASTGPNQLAPLASGSAEMSGTPRVGELSATSTSPASGGAANAGTVRIGTLPGQSQPTQLPANTIALLIARNLQKGVSRFDIRLDPPEMGRIDVRMEVRKDGQVVAHMTVDRPETLDLLQRDARALQQALNNAGLQADSDSLNFTLRDQNNDGGRQDFAGSDNHAPDDALSEETVPAPAYNINISANGGIDIRV